MIFVTQRARCSEGKVVPTVSLNLKTRRCLSLDTQNTEPPTIARSNFLIQHLLSLYPPAFPSGVDDDRGHRFNGINLDPRVAATLVSYGGGMRRFPPLVRVQTTVEARLWREEGWKECRLQASRLRLLRPVACSLRGDLSRHEQWGVGRVVLFRRSSARWPETGGAEKGSCV